MPCEICGSTTKSPKSKQHVNTQKHQLALNQGNHIKSRIPSININSRLEILEKQVKFVMNKLNKMEKDFLISQSNNIQSHRNVSKKILQVIPAKGSITVDNIITRLPNYSWREIERSLNILVDKEKIDVADGSSTRKLNNRFGRIIRR